MRPSDLAEEIRKRGLYTQRDGSPLKDRQIYARVGNYPELFVLVDGMISINNSQEVFVKEKKSTLPIAKKKKLQLKFGDITDFNLNPLDDWFHESHICASLSDHLCSHGFEIKKDTSSNKSEKGIDLVVLKDGVYEYIEVKGYPSVYYVEQKKRGLEKKTKPYLQSTHWFSGCLSSTLKNYESKETKLAMAFPACSRYEELVVKNQKYFTDNNLDIRIYFVDEKGNVTISNLNKALIHAVK